MASATFTEAGHIYQQDGAVIPSVTQVLTLAGLDDVSMIPPHTLELARVRGILVHEATRLLDEDDLDLESIDPAILGYVVGYQKFREEQGFIPKLIEHRMVGRSASGLAYGMCFDRLGRLAGHDWDTIFDIKTSSRPSASWAIQTAGYQVGWNQEASRMVVHVSNDGNYKLIPYSDENDFEVWDSALTVATWRLAHGAKLK